MGDVIPFLPVKVKFAFLDHLKDLIIVVAIKGWVTAKKNVEHTASGPHVARNVIVARQHLWRDVVRRSCSSLHSLKPASAHNLGEAEINDLEVRVIALVSEEEVLRFQIPVHNIFAVAVIESHEDLSE